MHIQLKKVINTQLIMGFKNTFELITKDIQEIENLVSNFQNSSNLPAIELDLVLSKLQNVYDLILMIKNHELNERSSGEIIEKQEQLEIKDIPNEIISDSVVPTEKVQDIKEVHQEATTTIEEPKAQEEPKAEIPPINPNKSEQKVQTISDKFEKNGEFLNEKLAGQNEILSRKIQSGPIENIASSIGINDKFYFIKELFQGKAEEFKKAIEILDEAANFNEAYNYISNHFTWDMKDEPVQNLLNLIRRKFISSDNE